MSATDNREASTPTMPGRGAATQSPSRAENETPSRAEADADVPDPVLSNFAPLPSALGVTYSLI